MTDLCVIPNFTTTRKELGRILDERETSHTSLGETVLARSIVSLADRRPSSGEGDWTHAAYEAIRAADGEVFCSITLARHDRFEGTDQLAYDTFSDSLLTEHHGVPRKILDKLTPTDNPSAVEWRKRAWGDYKRRAALRHLARTGKAPVVGLARPIDYASLGVISQVRVYPTGEWGTVDGKHRLDKPDGGDGLLNTEDLLRAL